MHTILSNRSAGWMRTARAGAILAILIPAAAPVLALDRAPRPMPVEIVPTADALTAVRFSLTVDGVEIAAFPHLREITSAVRPETPGDPQSPPVSTGLAILSRPQGRSPELWAWHEAVLLGNPGARRDATLIAWNANGQAIARYRLENAWPAKIEIGSLKAQASEVLIESVTIVCERIQRVSV